MKDRLNSRVKQRAWFRPFAPAILEERMSEFFEIDQLDPFMTMAPKVCASKAHLIPAAVHFDGTARLQTVGRGTNPLLHAVIEEFAGLTGVPVVLNTSFNLHEPIVESPADAVSCYLRAQMDVLVIGNFYSAREGRPTQARRRDEEQSPATYDIASVK
jgi:carbamoyltransferase